ncbi:hypothetical protein RF55_17384, partial [Lasius niger]
GFLWCSGRNLPRTKGNTLRLRGSASPSQSPSLTLDTKSRFCCVSNNAARIQLPHFTGKYEDWPAFRDLFQSIIGKDRNLSEVEKLHYLKSESAPELRKILNGVSSTAGTLESIDRPISKSEDLFVFLIVELLDVRTRREWENSTLKALQPGKSDSVATKSSDTGGRAARNHHVQKRETGSARCTFCKKDHALMLCEEFKSKPAQGRKQYTEENHLCENCLGKHKISDCQFKRLCSVCSEKHHTSLHDAFRKTSMEAESVRTSHIAHSASQRRSTMLLATARIRVADRFGNLEEARALIDQGSEATIITEKLAQRLRLPRSHSAVAIFGVGGQQTGTARGRVTLSVWS